MFFVGTIKLISCFPAWMTFVFDAVSFKLVSNIAPLYFQTFRFFVVLVLTFAYHHPALTSSKSCFHSACARTRRWKCSRMFQQPPKPNQNECAFLKLGMFTAVLCGSNNLLILILFSRTISCAANKKPFEHAPTRPESKRSYFLTGQPRQGALRC